MSKQVWRVIIAVHNGGDVFSLQQILGHATLDMVRRYVSLSEADLVARHRTASPADRLVGARG